MDVSSQKMKNRPWKFCYCHFHVDNWLISTEFLVTNRIFKPKPTFRSETVFLSQNRSLASRLIFRGDAEFSIGNRLFELKPNLSIRFDPKLCSDWLWELNKLIISIWSDMSTLGIVRRVAGISTSMTVQCRNGPINPRLSHTTSWVSRGLPAHRFKSV